MGHSFFLDRSQLATKLGFVILLALSAAGCQTSLQPSGRVPAADAYNEVFDSSGNLREAYTDIWPWWESLSESQKRRLLKEGTLAFQGDNALLPLPRLLTQEELDTLQTGVDQRAQALQAFLRDHYSGEKTYLDQIIPKEVMDRILLRTGDFLYEGIVDPDNIRFVYGPDIIRDAEGTWRVLEDNPGYVGGMGDLDKARSTLKKLNPELNVLPEQEDPKDFYKQLAEAFKKEARPENGLVVMYQIPPYPDNEDLRLRKLFQEQGIVVVTPNSKNKIVSTSRGLFLERPAQNDPNKVVRKRIGYLYMNGEHNWMDEGNPVTERLGWIEEAQSHLEEKSLKKKARKEIEKALHEVAEDGLASIERIKEALVFSNFEITRNRYKHTRIPGLVDHWAAGRVQLNYTPGLEFIGDKELNLFVEQMVRHYLNEEPILKNVATERFVKADGTLEHSLIQKVARNKKPWVIKVVDGRGGEGIWIGPKNSEEEWKAALESVKKNPSNYIVQKFTPLSLLGDYIIDSRVLSYVSPESRVFSRVPWGRGIPTGGSGLVNISKEGVEVANFGVASAADCGKDVVELLRK